MPTLLCLPQNTAAATNLAHQNSHRAALPRRFAARVPPKTTPRCQNTVFARDVLRFLKKTNHLSKTYGSERAEDHHLAQSTAPPRNLRIEVKPLRSPAPASGHQNTRFPFAARSGHQVRKCAPHHNESVVLESACGFWEPAQSKCKHFDVNESDAHIV